MKDADENAPEKILTPPPSSKAIRDPKSRASDVIPSGNLWPELPRRELDELLGTEFVLEDFSFLSGKYGDFAVFLARMPGTAQQFTSACGGEVVCRKLEKLKDGRHLPVLATITFDDRYYDLT